MLQRILSFLSSKIPWLPVSLRSTYRDKILRRTNCVGPLMFSADFYFQTCVAFIQVILPPFQVFTLYIIKKFCFLFSVSPLNYSLFCRTMLKSRCRWITQYIIHGLPWWSSAWESACQCRGHRFDPWSGKVPHEKWKWKLLSHIQLFATPWTI